MTQRVTRRVTRRVTLRVTLRVIWILIRMVTWMVTRIGLAYHGTTNSGDTDGMGLAVRSGLPPLPSTPPLTFPRYCWKQHEHSVWPTSGPQSCPPALVCHVTACHLLLVTCSGHPAYPHRTPPAPSPAPPPVPRPRRPPTEPPPLLPTGAGAGGGQGQAARAVWRCGRESGSGRGGDSGTPAEEATVKFSTRRRAGRG